MPRNWEFYNIFGSEPVSAEPGRGVEVERRPRERKIEKDGLPRWVLRSVGYGGGPAASREDGYPLFESRNAPGMKNAHG